MKVLDLQCRQAHVFEGWFGSEDDFQTQRGRGLVQCPLCGDDQIDKRLSAPRINLGARAPASSPGPAATHLPSPPQAVPAPAQAASRPPASVQGGFASQQSPQAQAAWLELARKIVAQTEDVGTQFAAEARRMHYGDVPERAIRGEASLEQTQALLEEGIPVLPLALPEAAKKTLQ
jgi:hypothetical protein